MGLFKREVKLNLVGDMALGILEMMQMTNSNWILVTGMSMCHIDENDKLIFHDGRLNNRKFAHILKMKDVAMDEFVDSVEKNRKVQMMVEIKGFQPYDLEYMKFANVKKK